MLRYRTALAALLLIAPPAGAQRIIARADSLLRAGRIFAAESLYYYAVDRQTHDPAARMALGRYLAARGRPTVGAVLMEEARYFGGDARTVARVLAPVYVQMGNWAGLASLPGSTVPYAERARAEWLARNPPAITGPDTATVAYVPDDSTLGRLALVIGDDTLEATIDPGAEGIVLDTSWARQATTRRFASMYDADVRRATAAVLAATLGPMTLVNVPAHFDVLGDEHRCRIGLAVLAQMAPTFDPVRGRLTLRRSGKLAVEPAGERIPTLAYVPGLWLARSGSDALWPIEGPEARHLLRDAVWTLDARRGELVVAPPALRSSSP